MLDTACPKPSPPVKKTRKPVKKVNAQRKRRLFQEDFGGEKYLAHIQAMPCELCGYGGQPSVAAHSVSRGAGGKAADIVPLCRPHFKPEGGVEADCHWRFDHIPTFHAKHKEPLRKAAAHYWKLWQESREECA